MLENHPHDISKEDFFGHKEKGDAIALFLKSNVSTLGKNKMFALYGEWGSGKTSLMQYISNELENTDYKTFFFEAWKHEKDLDINASLLDLITESLDNKEHLKAFFAGLKAFGKGLSFKSELLGLEMDFEKAISGTEEELKKIRQNISFYAKIKMFEEQFKEIEKKVLKGKKKIIVFVDDLDRCETENILDLLTTIKLFFTLGEKTIFFFGVDKKAVQQAVNSKYKDVVKSEEYLEKIFDVSFNMPAYTNAYSLLKYFFKEPNNKNLPILNHFFYQIKFSNPRHVKKILNKYRILMSFKKNSSLSIDIKRILPNIIDEEGNGEIFETIFTLYFIILNEYYPEKLESLFNLDEKRLNYGLAYHNKSKSDPGGNAVQMEGAIRSVQLLQITEAKFTLSELIKSGTSEKGIFEPFLWVFTPNKVDTFSFEMKEYELLRLFDNKKHEIEIGFCQFLIQNKDGLQKLKSDYLFRNYREMVEKLL